MYRESILHYLDFLPPVPVFTFVFMIKLAPMIMPNHMIYFVKQFNSN